MIRHLFTPHHTNNHRARILHPEMLLAIISVIFVFQLSFRITAQNYPGILGYATNISVDDLLLYTNKERLNNGLNSLQLNPVLSKAAEKKALDMFADDYWAHTSPDGTTPWDFIVSEGYSYSYAGENLARDFADSEGVVTAWMDSPSHKENILRDKYEEIGFAVVNGKLNGNETTLVVQMFGTPQTRIPAVTTASAQTPQSVISPVQSASVQKPFIDQTAMQRSMVLIVLGILGGVFITDGYLIWQRKTIRVAGHNFAHFIFIISLIGIILITSRGSVLSSVQ